MKFSSLKFIPALLLFNIFAPAKTEDLMQDFASKENATWDKASYQTITKNQNGEELKIRYFIDKKGNIYEFRRAPNFNSGPTKVGNLNEKKYSEGNTCFFGTNYECLSNITRTTYQYALEDGQLLQFSRTDYLKTNTKGDVDKIILGKKIVKDANFYFERALKKITKKDDEGAIKDLNIAISLNPNKASYYMNLGTAERGLGNYLKAVNAYSQSIKIDPKQPFPYLLRGHAKKDLGDIKGACEDWNKVLNLKDDQLRVPANQLFSSNCNN